MLLLLNSALFPLKTICFCLCGVMHMYIYVCVFVFEPVYDICVRTISLPQIFHVSVFYCYVTYYHKFNGLNHIYYLIVSVGPESRHCLARSFEKLQSRYQPGLHSQLEA